MPFTSPLQSLLSSLRVFSVRTSPLLSSPLTISSSACLKIVSPLSHKLHDSVSPLSHDFARFRLPILSSLPAMSHHYQPSSWTKEDPKYCCRPVDTNVVKLRINHGGNFVHYPCKVYVDGKVEEMRWKCDVDLLCYMDLMKVVNNLGYVRIKGMWYHHPKFSLERGLRPLNNDADVLKFGEDMKGFDIGDIYVEHVVDEPEVITEEEVREYVEPVSDPIEIDLDESSEDEDFVEADKDASGDSEFEELDGDDWDWTHEIPSNTFLQENNGPNEGSMNQEPTKAADFEEPHVIDSDDLDTPPGSEEESEVHKYPKFRMPEHCDEVKLELGMTFSTKNVVKDAIKSFAMERKKNLHLKKNDRTRIVVKCEDECPFHMRFSKRASNQFWQLVSLTDEHTCHRTARNRQAKTEWLGKKFIPLLRHTPEMRPKGLVAEALEKWGVKLSLAQAYRAKTRALELIQGAETDQYAYLRNYAEELRRSNPNTTVIIKCGMSDIGPVFERIYVCLEACKAAFAHTCRPLIGLDACFLKGEYGGQLMAAVGKDGNNQIYPIAYAVVEAETKDSWKWFLDILLQDLNNVMPRSYGFISDQQKGLVPAIADLGPNVEHRLCVKHLYGNWKKKYPGVHMKELLWQAARATVVPDWERAMEKIKVINKDAWKDMTEIPPPMWARSAFRTDSHCDLQVNNMCEAFNMAILEYRDKPIITLLEGLKHYITTRIVKQKNLIGRFKGTICPKVQETIERSKRAAGGWTPTWHGDDAFNIFSVTNGVDTFELNLQQHHCACRKWALSGIPCVHALACILYNKADVYPYISQYYRKSTFLATYSYIVLPSNGPRLWPATNVEMINPPVMRRAPGRPKKKRNRANDEPTPSNVLPRNLTTVKCKRCGTLGHNSRTCKGKTVADRKLAKGSNKSKKQRSTKESKESPTVLTQGSQAPQTQENIE